MSESVNAFSLAVGCKHTENNHESDDTCWECTMKIVELTKVAEARATELAAQLATVQAALKQVTQERDEALKQLDESNAAFDHIWLGPVNQ